jgi:hypothetical protein
MDHMTQEPEQALGEWRRTNRPARSARREVAMGAAEMLAGTPTIGAVIFEGISVTDGQGSPAHLAVVDGHGHVVAAGPELTRAAWAASIEAYRNHLRGHGHL